MTQDIPTFSDESSDERPSKSQLKREMHALQALGEQIIAMTPTERARFPLSRKPPASALMKGAVATCSTSAS